MISPQRPDLAARPAPQRPRHATLARLVVMCLAGAAGASFLALTPPAALAQEAARHYSIPAGPLSTALNQLGREAGVLLSFSTSLTHNLETRGLEGRYDVAGALAALLAGTGLQAVREANGGYTVRRQPGAAPVTALPAVTVAGSGTGRDTSAPYAGGEVARGGRVGMLGNKDFMETPFSTIAYTEEAIGKTQSGNLLRVISDADPGVSTTGNDYDLSNYAAVHIRGFNTAGLEDLGINGLYGLASYGNRSVAATAQRVEVLKGPSALLNGMMPNGSVSGAVNVQTKRATDEPISRLSLGYESRSIYTGGVDVGRRFGDEGQWGVRVNATTRKGDTPIHHKSVNNQIGSLGLDYRGARLRVGFDWIYNRELTHGPSAQIQSSLSEVPAPPTHDMLIASEPWNRYQTKGDLMMLKGEYDLGDTTQVWASVGRNHRNMAANVVNWRLVNIDGDFTRNTLLVWNSRFENVAADAGLQTRFETGPVRHDITVNANVSRRTVYQARVQHNLAGAPGGNIYDPTYIPQPDIDYYPDEPKSNENTLRSVAIADTLSMFDNRLQLTLGLRHQQVKQKSFSATTGQVTGTPYDESATTPAIAGLFRITERISVYGNYIEGLSAGAQAPATALNAGEIFAPYKTRQKEIGIKFDNRNFATTLALFEIRRPSSFIDPATNLFSFGGEQRNRGVEWEVFGSPIQGLAIRGGVSWKQAVLTKTQGGVNQGNTAPEVPRFEAKLGLAYDIAALPGLTLTANAIHTSSQYIDQSNDLSIPSWRRYDLGLIYGTRLGATDVVLRGTVFNVTNARHWYGSLWRGVSQPRTVTLSAEISF